MQKTLLALLLCLSLLLCLAACSPEQKEPGPSAPIIPPVSTVQTSASGSLSGGAITWTLYSDGRLVIAGSGQLPDLDAATDQPWYTYGAVNWSDRTDSDQPVQPISKLIVREGITGIGEFAFADCETLTDVTLPTTLSCISYSAFRNCPLLHTVRGGFGLTTVETNAFHSCTVLESIELSSALTTVEIQAFYKTGDGNKDGKLAVSFRGSAAQWQALCEEADTGNTPLINAAVEYVTS